jgi:hypothetical protein
MLSTIAERREKNEFAMVFGVVLSGLNSLGEVSLVVYPLIFYILKDFIWTR